MTVIAQRLELAYPATNTGWGITLFPMAEMFTGRIWPVLLILLGAVGLLLLIACANLANLLLARAATREKEIVIRGALGAGRGRIVRQLVTESLMLSVSGGALGLILAIYGVRLMRGVVPDMFPMLQHMSVDLPVLAFTRGISILTGLLFGLVPAWRSSCTDLNTTLKEAAGRSEGGGGSHRIRSFLLASEVALAVLLSVSADSVTWLPIKSAGVSLADPDHPVAAEMRYGRWRKFSGVRFPTHRVNYHSGVNRGEVTSEIIQVNAGLKPKELATKPADFAPEIPRR